LADTAIIASTQECKRTPLGPDRDGSADDRSTTGIAAATDVALDWYLSDAECQGLDDAIPDPPVGSDWTSAESRLRRIAWLLKQVESTHGAERDLWLKSLQQARNYERLVQLKDWWKASHP
jgi:hypothetical protein